MSTKKRVLLGAYAFSPTLGSEFAQGWNYVQQMQASCNLTVLVGSSNGRMGDFALLDHPAVKALGDAVEIVRIEPDLFCRIIKWLDVRLGMSWLFVLGLRRWHWLAYQQAKRLHATRRFEVAHQLGPVGFRNPGYLYRLGIPSYWGPIGGFQYIDLKLAFRSSPRYGVISLVRNISTYLAAHSVYVKAAVEGFQRLSFATTTNRLNFEALYGVQGPVLSDQATARRAADVLDKPAPAPLRVVWCGSVDARKNIRLLLDIAARLQSLGSPVSITVIGSGGQLEAAIQDAQTRQLGNIRFTRQLPRPQVQQQFRAAHVLSFTSLSEANTSTFFEALEAGCIPVALDLDGFSSNITDDIGAKIGTAGGWDSIVDAYASCLAELAADSDRRARHVAAIQRDADRFSWATLAARHATILDGLAAKDR
jgi:glycosyltransferase involved in cell wall biosynthesis